MGILCNELLALDGRPWLLVLDDYHLIGNPAVHALTATLLEARPPGMRALLASRSSPPLPLARWRARGRLIELGASHLRLEDAEARTWLERAAPELPPDAVSRIVAQCEGWGAGLQLARALFAANGGAADAEAWIPRLTGDHPFVADFLLSEVFDRQPEAVQAFLLATAVLPQMTDELCVALLNDTSARGVLADLERAQLFVSPLDEHRTWYRYHPLFREFLLGRLQRRDPARLADLRGRACRILEAAGEAEAALREYLDTGRAADASRVLLGIGESLLQSGRLEQLDGYLRNLAAEIEACVELELLAGRVARRLGRTAEAADRLDRVADGNAAPATATAAFIELSQLAHARGDYPAALAHATRAVQAADGADSPSLRAVALMERAKNEGLLYGMDRGRDTAEAAVAAASLPGTELTPFGHAQLLRSLAEICWWHGDLGASVDACQRALRRLPEERSPLGAEIRLTLAAAILYRHEYDRALAHAEEALELCQTFALHDRLPKAYAVLGNTLTRMGRFEEAEQRLRRAIELAEDLQAASYDGVMAATYLAFHLQARGRYAEATEVARSALWRHRHREPVYEVYVCKSVLADCHLDEGRIAEAKAIFQELIPLGEARRYRIPLSLAYFGLAYVHLRMGERDQALPAALRSLDLLAPSGAWELYADQRDRADAVCELLAEVAPDDPFLAHVQGARAAHAARIATASAPDRLEVRTLGGLSVLRDGVPLPAKAWVSAKAKEALALFLTFRADELSLERAMEALWPGEPERDRSAFHTALYRLREALRRDGEKTKFVVVESKQYHLDAARFTLDVDAFDRLLDEARTHAGGSAEEARRQAADLYRGEYLAELDHAWVVPERDRLRRAYLETLEALATSAEARGDLLEALERTRQRLHVDPLLESAHCTAMRLLHAQGDRHGVVRQYRQLRDLLAAELEIAPMDETVRLYERLTSAA